MPVRVKVLKNLKQFDPAHLSMALLKLIRRIYDNGFGYKIKMKHNIKLLNLHDILCDLRCQKVELTHLKLSHRTQNWG